MPITTISYYMRKVAVKLDRLVFTIKEVSILTIKNREPRKIYKISVNY